MSVIYLKKDSSDLVSHCSCTDALITFPPQMDCPWCGCGWLFTCMTCRKAFTFARAVEVKRSLEELAVADITNGWGRKPDDDDIAEWVEAMRTLLTDVQPGQTYVTLDGRFLPTTRGRVSFVGWHARHDLAELPHLEALGDDTVLNTVLANADYWMSRHVAEDDG